MRAVFLDRNSLDRDDLDFSEVEKQVSDWTEYDSTAVDQVDERIADAEIVVVNKVVLDALNLQRATKLRLVCVIATGTNNVDLRAAADLGIRVCNCQAYGTESVVQHVLALMLALSTRLLQYHQAVEQGDWGRSSQFCLLDYPIMELSGKTLGIVGYGELGRGVARIAEALGMRVLVAERRGAQPRAGRLALDDLLPEVDVLSLHCPLTEDTAGLIGASELALMKPQALLVNASRGGIVDEPALVSALDNGRLGGAGVDVLSTEPPAQGNVLLDCGHPNLIVTPHSAWGSREARQRILAQLAENIEAFARGEPLRVVA